ncbi:helix-turn-helix transcriptional regulator [Ruminiclostridium cellobioparum]|uniref:helix-turn-helix transcriptional regulator n=1 Tax=Ruminiclostridium cellobioparum TaxID=29355 RepID=UPI0028AD21F6|nr:helix-turn-helix transcriptional regulator [Ruminiclostridium cellobioparum]
MKDNKKNNNLKELRSGKDLTQKQVAEPIGITASYLGMIENGVRIPNLEIAKAIADFFGKNIEDIFFNL